MANFGAQQSAEILRNEFGLGELNMRSKGFTLNPDFEHGSPLAAAQIKSREHDAAHNLVQNIHATPAEQLKPTHNDAGIKYTPKAPSGLNA
jgi:hypothetical protein